jgi:hypothetical protein
MVLSLGVRLVLRLHGDDTGTGGFRDRGPGSSISHRHDEFSTDKTGAAIDPTADRDKIDGNRLRPLDATKRGSDAGHSDTNRERNPGPSERDGAESKK